MPYFGAVFDERFDLLAEVADAKNDAPYALAPQQPQLMGDERFARDLDHGLGDLQRAEVEAWSQARLPTTQG